MTVPVSGGVRGGRGLSGRAARLPVGSCGAGGRGPGVLGFLLHAAVCTSWAVCAVYRSMTSRTHLFGNEFVIEVCLIAF